MKKKIFLISNFAIIFMIIFTVCICIYKRDRNKFEPKLWIGFFDYRLNFRDVGQSLNECLNQEVFQTKMIYRSNRYFSGWSCKKIHNPDKIYSLNYSPSNPHSYYCLQNNGKHLVGIHPNTTFEISDIENISNWKKPEFKNSMCVFFKETLNDLIEKKSFLYHCDMGRDRTGTFTAMLTQLLAEQKNYNHEKILNGIECDYEKTHSLEIEKRGKMKLFLQSIERQGGVSQFIESQCGISKQVFKEAADQFFIPFF